jgi:hypothetical protein
VSFILLMFIVIISLLTAPGILRVLYHLWPLWSNS